MPSLGNNLKEAITSLYHLNVIAMIKLSSRVYRLKCTSGDYILKQLDNREAEAAYGRLDLLNNQSFLIPIKNIYDQFVSEYDNYLFEITPYFPEEGLTAKALRLRHFLIRLSELHFTSQYYLKVNEGFYGETFDLIAHTIQSLRQELDQYLTSFESLDYKSPSQWLLMLNNPIFFRALDSAYEHLLEFQKLTTDKPQLRVSLVYQNFDYSHILMKHDKIIGTQKLTVAPPIYDIKYLFDFSNIGSYDLSGVLGEYLLKFPLLQYEKEWLLALLLIPTLKIPVLKSNHEVDSIVTITRSIYQLKNAREVETILTEDETKNN